MAFNAYRATTAATTLRCIALLINELGDTIDNSDDADELTEDEETLVQCWRLLSASARDTSAPIARLYEAATQTPHPTLF